MSTPNPVAVVHAYRNLYRGLLRAVQYSKPARYTARDQLRDAFRKEHPATYNQEKIDRTIEFLALATKYSGLEHRILKNLIHTNYLLRHNNHNLIKKARTPLQKEIRSTTRIHYDMTLAMLNDSIGLCLR
ncbi:uncharacterized protein PAC_03151 [Phialocephala subalpina]|uniref:Uncharacterized protein n=1 Tax=Phialocephala subalpina TaxID=576137 RepID=A0A1L7WKL3_9HELO|nr:uncharacterized protein PAC_03151 [Phialocephala subalpina]